MRVGIDDDLPEATNHEMASIDWQILSEEGKYYDCWDLHQRPLTPEDRFSNGSMPSSAGSALERFSKLGQGIQKWA
jgi:hypothetical protein